MENDNELFANKNNPCIIEDCNKTALVIRYIIRIIYFGCIHTKYSS